TYTVPLALIGFLLGGLTPATLVIVAALACRFALQADLHRLFQLDNGWSISLRNLWLCPVRGVFSFFLFLASFFCCLVEWRGHCYGVRADSTLARYGEAES